MWIQKKINKYIYLYIIILNKNLLWNATLKRCTRIINRNWWILFPVASFSFFSLFLFLFRDIMYLVLSSTIDRRRREKNWNKKKKKKKKERVDEQEREASRRAARKMRNATSFSSIDFSFPLHLCCFTPLQRKYGV